MRGLPVRGDAPPRQAQDMACQIRNPNPWRNQKARVVDHLLQIGNACRCAPANMCIARLLMPTRGVKGQRTNHPQLLAVEPKIPHRPGLCRGPCGWYAASKSRTKRRSAICGSTICADVTHGSPAALTQPSRSHTPTAKCFRLMPRRASARSHSTVSVLYRRMPISMRIMCQSKRPAPCVDQ